MIGPIRIGMPIIRQCEYNFIAQYGMYILAGATAATGAYSAVASHNAGIEASNQTKMQARTDADAAAQRELERRRSLMRSLASQNAAAGAGGVETSGSIGGMIRSDIRYNQNDLSIDAANNSARQQALASQARAEKRRGDAGAVTSLLDTAGKEVRIVTGR